MKHIYKTPALLIFLSASTICLGNDAQGCKVGSILVKPSIGVTEKYNDNIYTQNKRRVSDYITEVSPRLRLEATDTPHKFHLTTGVDQNWYARHSRDHFTDFNVGAGGRYVFNNEAFWDLSGLYRRLHSSRGDSQTDPTANAVKPIPYNMYNADTAFYKRFQKITMRPRLGLVAYDYKSVARLNGGILDQDGRDRVQTTYGGNFGYDLPNKFQLFTDLEGNVRDYKRSIAILNRDSRGGSYLVGLQYRPHTKVLANLAGGYMHQKWRNSAVFRNIGAWNAAARLDWQFNENEHDKLRFNLRRSIYEVTDVGSSASIRTDVTASLSHTLYGDVVGVVGGRYSRYDYQGGLTSSTRTSDRRDNLYEGRLGLVYKYNHNVALTADYTYRDYKSNLLTSNYKRSMVMLGVKFGYLDKLL